MCECDQDCVDILRGMLPGCEVWKDICVVTEEDIRQFFDRWPDARGVVQSGGSPCQGLSQLSSERLHFDDPRSNLMRLVKEEATRRGMWHVGFVENVVCVTQMIKRHFGQRQIGLSGSCVAGHCPK